MELANSFKRPEKAEPACPRNSDIVRIINFGPSNLDEFKHLESCQLCRNRLELIGAFTLTFPVLVSFGTDVLSVLLPLTVLEDIYFHCTVIPCFETPLLREIDQKSFKLEGGIISSKGVPSISKDGQSLTIGFHHCQFDKRVKRSLDTGGSVTHPVTLSGGFSSWQLYKHKIFGEVRIEFKATKSLSAEN